MLPSLRMLQRSRDGARLLPMWPSTDSSPEFVGSPLCSERFFLLVLRFSPLLKNHLRFDTSWFDLFLYNVANNYKCTSAKYSWHLKFITIISTHPFFVWSRSPPPRALRTERHKERLRGRLVTTSSNSTLKLFFHIECFHMTSRQPCWKTETKKQRPCWRSEIFFWELNFIFIQILPFVLVCK